MMKKVFCILAVLFVSICASAQKRTVSGTVTDANQEPMIGVSVLEKGTTNGVVTDINGRFSLSVAPSGAILQVSYVGYMNKEVAVGNQTNLTIVLQEDNEQLEEVVVVGYGTQKKADLTSAIGTLKADQVLASPGGITDAVQGAIAGVNVSGGKIRIRGTSSITGNTDPLWVIDGIIGEQDDVPNDNEIESIQILKDAASAAIYGVRGANGVILVTTKRGREGAPRINFNGRIGTGTAQKKLKMLNAQDYAIYANEIYYNAASDADKADGSWALLVPEIDGDPYNQEYDTNWQDEFFFDNVYQQYDVSINGGSKLFNYNFGTSYQTDKRIGVDRSGDRNNIFANVQGTKGRLTYGGFVRVNANKRRNTAIGSLQNILQSSPNVPVRTTEEALANNVANGGLVNPDMLYVNSSPGTPFDNGTDVTNMAFFIHEDKNRDMSWRGQANVFAQLQIVDWLSLKVNYNYTFYTNYNERIQPKYTLEGGAGGTKAYNEMWTSSNRRVEELTNAFLNFNKSFGKHSVQAMIGTEAQTLSNNSSSWNGRSNEYSDYEVPGMYQTNVSGSGDRWEEAYYSVLGRVQYNYAGRYMLTANFRADESSKFAPGNRWGTFPSLSVGWRLSEESWAKSFLNKLKINDLKVRATYGYIGSSIGVGRYSYQPTIQITGKYSFGPHNLNLAPTEVPAPRPNGITNRTLSWEKTRDMGIGFDLTALNNRLVINFDYYNRKASDMLLNVNLPVSVGLGTSVTQNVGSMTNWGLELAATWRDKIGAFSYNISPNFSFYRNKVNDMGPLDVLTGGYLTLIGQNATHTVVGHPVAQFWGLKTAGLFQTDAEAAAYKNKDGDPMQPKAKAGDLKFVDYNGDGYLGDDDRTFIGSSIPAMSVGLNITLGYKGFDFSMLMQGDLGVDVYNNFKQTLLNGKEFKSQLAEIKNAFRAEDVTFTTRKGVKITLPKNTNTSIPRAVAQDPNANSTTISDYFVEDASYLRCNNMTLGYTFSKQLLKKVSIENLRLYVGIKNPWTITSYSMLDPQVPNGGNTLDRGIDGRFYDFTGTYISQREYFAGIQLSF